MSGQTSSSDASTLLQATLSKIRHHTNSKLENQKAPAQLLKAIEETLKDQNPVNPSASATQEESHPNPNEYFLALDSMVQKAGAPDVSV